MILLNYLNWYTVGMERFAGLNIRGFNPIDLFTEILSRCLGHKCSSFSIIKERCLYSWKTFCYTLKNYEGTKISPAILSMFMVVMLFLAGYNYLSRSITTIYWALTDVDKFEKRRDVRMCSLITSNDTLSMLPVTGNCTCVYYFPYFNVIWHTVSFTCL